MLALLVCILSVGSAAAADCTEADAKVAQLTAEVASLRKQLAAAQASPGQCEISVSGAVTKTRSMASDLIQHLLDKTEIDDHVVKAVSGQADAAKGFASGVVGQITSHPCSSDYDKCVKNITGSSIYLTHVAPLVKQAQPHVDAAMAHPHVKTALETAQQAKTKVDKNVIPTLKESANTAHGHVSSIVFSTPEHVQKVLDPVFGAVGTAAPKHRNILPKTALDRLLLVAVALIIAYYFLWVGLPWAIFLCMLAVRICYKLSVKLPLKVAGIWASWSFWFATGFYVCGLCRRRKAGSAAAASNGKTPAKAKAKSGAEAKNGASKAATEQELVTMLEKTKEKGKLNDGVARLVAAAKDGKCLQAPKDMEGKQVTKDVLKKALAKFKDVDMKKLGL